MTTHYFKAIYAELDKGKTSLNNELITLIIQEADPEVNLPRYSDTSRQVLTAFAFGPQQLLELDESSSKGRIRIEANGSLETRIIHDIKVNSTSVILSWIVSSTECWIKAKLTSGINLILF